MTSRASLVLLSCLAAGAPAFVVVACSSKSSDPPVTPPVETDAGLVLDTKPGPVDAKKETPPPFEVGYCDQALESDFACKSPAKTPGGTACSEADLDGFTTACFKPNTMTSPSCTKWQAEHASCYSCAKSWTYTNGRPARDNCYYQVMTTSCSNAVKCYFDCVTKVCADCADAEENLECQKRARVAGGGCYENSYKQAEAEKCFDEMTLDPCTVNELGKTTSDPTILHNELMYFYRGACRDNANWKNAKEGVDAGVPADSGAPDTSTPADTGAVADTPAG